MNTIQCQNCQYLNEASVPFCDRCGAPLFKQAKKVKKRPRTEKYNFQILPDFLVYGTDNEHHSGQIVLVQLPLFNEPKKPQINAYAAELNKDLYEARLALSKPLPQVIGVGDYDALAPTCQNLLEQTIPIMMIDAPKMFEAFQAWQVDSVEFSENLLSIFANNERFDLDANAEILVLHGRYEHAQRVDAKRTGTRRTGSLAAKTRGLKKSQWDTQRIDFIHLYHVDEPYPFVFIERAITDYSFLGADMQPASNVNFALMRDRLDRLPFSRVEKQLHQHSQIIAESFSLGGSVQSLLPVVTTDDTKSNESMANVLSKILFQAWWGHCL